MWRHLYGKTIYTLMLLLLFMAAGCDSASESTVSFMEPHPLNQKAHYIFDINKSYLPNAFFLQYSLQDGQTLQVRLKKFKSDGDWETLLKLSLEEESGKKGIVTVYSDSVSGLQILNISGEKASSGNKALILSLKTPKGSNRAFTAISQRIPLLPGEEKVFMVMVQGSNKRFLSVPFPEDVTDSFRAEGWNVESVCIWSMEIR